MPSNTITREGAVYQRSIGGGRELCVYPRIYNSILTIGPEVGETYETHYCYENPVQAMLAAEQWNPAEQAEPEGWFRHAASGRRRPHGNKEEEYIAP
jgi:hypothetical protein